MPAHTPHPLLFGGISLGKHDMTVGVKCWPGIHDRPIPNPDPTDSQMLLTRVYNRHGLQRYGNAVLKKITPFWKKNYYCVRVTVKYKILTGKYQNGSILSDFKTIFPNAVVKLLSSIIISRSGGQEIKYRLCDFFLSSRKFMLRTRLNVNHNCLRSKTRRQKADVIST